MTRGEFLTRLTIWLALSAYAIGAGIELLARGRPRWQILARGAWTIGCACFLAHVACAFSFYHHWSHTAAYRDTARQVEERVGLRWGGGLFLNYFMALAWLADVLWWWLAPERWARRSLGLTILWHGFLFFMVFNATVVFGSGPVRGLGVILCGGLLGLWLWSRTRTLRRARR